jgi:hypothetical protein
MSSALNVQAQTACLESTPVRPTKRFTSIKRLPRGDGEVPAYVALAPSCRSLFQELNLLQVGRRAEAKPGRCPDFSPVKCSIRVAFKLIKAYLLTRRSNTSDGDCVTD